METVIVICLFFIIALLVEDRINHKKKSDRTTEEKNTNQDFYDIMGVSGSAIRHSLPNTAVESHKTETENIPDNFELQYNESVETHIQQEGPQKVISSIPDLYEEEKALRGDGFFDDHNGLAQGVTFEELGTAEMLLKKEKLEPSQKDAAVAIVQKIHGTELFDLLENSVEDASRKITLLLDGIHLPETGSGSSILPRNSFKDFDVKDFI
ncbi:conjugal transfer protein TraD [Elizabethkingia anophelis]|nr:conjugal transfer protein TraD [Elizabethkingia anophelis]